jgi:hypothetical protein
MAGWLHFLLDCTGVLALEEYSQGVRCRHRSKVEYTPGDHRRPSSYGE